MKIGILCIGDELLMGKVNNSNAQNIARELNDRGYPVEVVLTIGDDPNKIQQALEFFNAFDILFVTGGLGNTHDDLTKKTLKNKKEFILVGQIQNQIGVEPGLIFKKENRTIYALPGPPRENKSMIELIANSLVKKKQYVMNYKIYNMPELQIESKMLSILPDEWKDHFATYVGFGITDVLYRASTMEELTTVRQFIQEIFQENLLSDDGRDLSECVLDALREKRLTLKLVESVTGGMIASTLVNVPRASDILYGSYVVYQKAFKDELFLTDEHTNHWGTVSKEITELLANNRLKNDDEVVLAVTGYAHTGECYISLASRGTNKSWKVELKYNDRNLNRHRLVTISLLHLLEFLREEK